MNIHLPTQWANEGQRTKSSVQDVLRVTVRQENEWLSTSGKDDIIVLTTTHHIIDVVMEPLTDTSTNTAATHREFKTVKLPGLTD